MFAALMQKQMGAFRPIMETLIKTLKIREATVPRDKHGEQLAALRSLADRPGYELKAISAEVDGKVFSGLVVMPLKP